MVPRNTSLQRIQLWDVSYAHTIRLPTLTVSLDLRLRFLHLLEQLRITNHAGSIPGFAACVVQSSNDPHDGALWNVRKISDLFERLRYRQDSMKSTQKPPATDHAPRPLIHHLHQVKFEVMLALRGNHFVLVLYPSDPITYLQDGIHSLLQFRRKLGFYVRLLLENETREERNDLFRLISGKRILQDQFGENKLIGGVDLPVL